MASTSLGFAQNSPDYEQRFDTAWQLVEERYWDRDFNGHDWNEIRAEYRPEALAAEDESKFYSVLEAMYEELGDNHSVFVPPSRVDQIRAEYGDLPCLGVFGQVIEPQGAEQRGRVSYKLLDDNVGYIRVPDLVGTAGDLRGAVQNLRAAQSFILDLRGNPRRQACRDDASGRSFYQRLLMAHLNSLDAASPLSRYRQHTY